MKNTVTASLTIAVLVLISFGLYAQPAAQPVQSASQMLSPDGVEQLKLVTDSVKSLGEDLVVLQKAITEFHKDQQELANLTLGLVLNAECAKAGGTRCQYNTQGTDPAKWTLMVTEPKSTEPKSPSPVGPAVKREK